MLRGVRIGLCILVIGVFAYVGYSSYATRQSDREAEPTARTRGDVRTEPMGATLPATPPTGDAAANGNGLVAQGGGAAGMTTPATDSIAPNPPNGMTFGGTGHFQLYRQGDLTWRLNTDSGETCVIFATDEEWRKPKVYRAGCRGR